MEVTKHNFNELLPTIFNEIESSDFIALDGEFTGLGRKGDNQYHELDTPEVRYVKAKGNVSRYALLQIGISFFKKDLKKKELSNSTFSFYLSGNPKCWYVFDSDSMTFLADNGFDFNKSFRDGIPFMSLDDVEKKRKQESKRNRDKYEYTPVMIKTKDLQTFFTTTMDILSKCSENKDKHVFDGKTLSPVHRKLIFNNVAQLYGNASFKNVPEDANRSIEVTFFDSAEDKKKNDVKLFEEKLEADVGFSTVIKKIIEAQIPLVGHCGVLDLLHIVDKFVISLPDTYNEFKSIVAKCFPIVYDTKLICRDPPFSKNILNSGLVPMYEVLTSQYKPPNVATEDNLKSYSVDEPPGQAHDAGFDAFMTGVAYLTMVKTLEGKKFLSKSPGNSNKLKELANKIYVLRTYDWTYMDLRNTEVLPDRNNIFQVICPSSYSQTDVRNLFPSLVQYKMMWVNSTKVFVAPEDPVVYPMNMVQKKEGVTVTTYGGTATGKTKSKKHSLDEKPPLVKRLKSEDVSQLSNMTLNSPIEEQKSINVDHSNGAASSNTIKLPETDIAKAIAFVVPDKWDFG